MNRNILIAHIVQENYKRTRAKDFLKIALTVAVLCTGTITGNVQIVGKKFIPMKMIMMES